MQIFFLKLSKMKPGLLMITFVIFCSCQWLITKNQEKQLILALRSSPTSQVVMTYNVENLFDTQDDPQKEDNTFLPLKLKNTHGHKRFCQKIKIKKWRQECLYKDWSESLLHLKLQRLSGSILQINAGKGPDLLILEEVENINVLEKLNKDFLSPADYRSVVLIEGDDPRGIDLAMLSRWPMVGPGKLHRIPGQAKLRGILHADFLLPDGSVLTSFAVHLPNPTHGPQLRTQVLNFLNALTEGLPKNRLVLVGGDFNISKSEDKKMHRYKDLAKSWLVSHLVGCDLCKGTHYYKSSQEWSFLDALLFSKNFDLDQNGTWFLDKASVQIPKAYPLQSVDGRPKSLDQIDQAYGVSDHFPMAALIRQRKISQKHKGAPWDLNY
ncbi:MAG: endonuclease/exonuclease/phosphatase family protein [Pseudobdellovibrionaceae bacterium]